jgi:hypothetical protein
MLFLWALHKKESFFDSISCTNWKKKSCVQFQTPIYSSNCKPTFGEFILLLISISPETFLIQSPSRWKQKVPLKHWKKPTRQYDLTSQNKLLLFLPWEPPMSRNNQLIQLLYTASCLQHTICAYISWQLNMTELYTIPPQSNQHSSIKQNA